jgi:HEAT repeat protein
MHLRKLIASFGMALLLCGCREKPTSHWLEQLHSKDSSKRLHAVNALGQRSKDAAVVVPALAEALKDPDAFVRREAAGALGKLGSDARLAVPALLAAFKDRNTSVRKEAGHALKQIDPEAAARAGVP